MPPWALVHCTNACKPYVGPTNARGSNGLVLLAMVPIVIVVSVTPTSDAVLPGPPWPPGPEPDCPVPPPWLPAPALDPAPGASGPVLPMTPPGPTVEVMPPGP